MVSFYQDDGWFNSEVGILMEFCDGSLLDCINMRKTETLGLYSEREILEIMLQICEGLAYLHRKQIIHRDIKIVRFASFRLAPFLMLQGSFFLSFFLFSLKPSNFFGGRTTS